MKKALMVLSFAMCASLAFAQTSHVTSKHALAEKQRMPLNPGAEEVDYKASIFGKAGNYDTIYTFRFKSSEMGTNGIEVGTISNSNRAAKKDDGTDTNLANHTVVSSWGNWHRFGSLSDMENTIFTVYPTFVARFFCGDGQGGQDFTFVNRYMGSQYQGNDTGWVDDGFMTLGYDASTPEGIVNSYIKFPAKARPAEHQGKMVFIGVHQIYYSFYDQCFVDYKVGSNWYFTEINVNGIDCDVNSMASIKNLYAMPYRLASENNIEIRLRASSNMETAAAYGYAWFVDDVALVVCNLNQNWNITGTYALDGLYGTIPQGMSLPISYGVNVRNIGANDIEDVKLQIYGTGANGQWSASASDNLIAESDNAIELPAGDIAATYSVYVNERGLFNDTIDASYGTHNWLGYYQYLGTDAGYGSHQGRGLNTATAGPNFYAPTLAGDITSNFDTTLYTVSGNLVFSDSDPRVSGYRWARDNGLVASGTAFGLAYTANHYVTDNDTVNSFNEGYRVEVRYLTGNTIPVDANGEPWVIRGIELVPATDGRNEAVTTPAIAPLLLKESYDEQYMYSNAIPTGAPSAVGISADSVNNVPGPNGTDFALPQNNTLSYSALDIMTPNQPALEPNTAYRVGYQLTAGARFRVATQAFSYRDQDNESHSYRDNAQTAPYYRQNTPYMPYDIMVTDGTGTSRDGSSRLLGWYADAYPMIRLIVGPKMALPQAKVAADCSVENNTSVSIEFGDVDLCEEDFQEVPVGTDQIFYVFPADSHTVITKIFVNGVEIGSDDDEIDDNAIAVYHAYNYDVEDEDGNILLARKYYAVLFNGIQKRMVNGAEQAHVISATTTYEDFSVGIDPANPEVSMRLYPNPATSTVSLNLSGVNGMVNCSIIDMSGRVVYNANVNAEATSTINVSNIPAGAYFVRVTNHNFSKIEKLIIK